jgi:hypothetical protein
MNELIHQAVQYLNDSGLGGLIGMFVFMAVMALGWKAMDKINGL